MDSRRKHILLVESDPEISHLIAYQTLQPLGYEVTVVESASAVIQDEAMSIPDLIITDLNLPGLSGKDLLVALASRGIVAPIIVIANKGQEVDILQALRLGAVDFLTCPIRETEVINVIEKTLNKQPPPTEQEFSLKQVDQTKSEIIQQVRAFSEISSISKNLLSGDSLQPLYEKLAKAASLVTEADRAWIISLDAKQNQFILQTCLNGSPGMQATLDLPYEDELTAIVTVSGQAVSIYGEALSRFHNPDLLDSALVVPIKQGEKVIALISVAKKTAQPFSSDQQAILELVAGYGAVLLEISQHLRLLEHSLLFQQQANVYATIESNLRYDLLSQASLELRHPLRAMMDNVDLLFSQGDRRLNRDQAIALKDIQEDTATLMTIADTINRIYQEEMHRTMEQVDLNVLVRTAIARLQPVAEKEQLSFRIETPPQPAIIKAYPSQVANVVEGLVSNALKYSPPRGQITVIISHKDDHYNVTVEDQGEVSEERLTEKVFERRLNTDGPAGKRFGGIGISLPMIKEIINAYKGRIWINHMEGRGFSVTFTLPRT